MIPVIAIVGRPNVGKSTLFNCLTKTRDAIVADLPGVTRDRQYGEGKLGDKAFIVVDTGGIEEEKGLPGLMTANAKAAIAEADVILFLVDGQSGATSTDISIAKELRQLKKSVWLVVNKTDGLDPNIAKGDFYQLGLKEPIAIAAAHGRGVNILIETVLKDVETETEYNVEPKEAGIKIALIGRPNVGKSTLTNRILGEERVLVFDAPGTTRDSIFIPFERRGQKYTLIDTAGIRRRTRIEAAVEKFSVVKSMQAIQVAHVVVFIIDAYENIAEQDLRLIGHVLEKGRALVIVINKWDGMEQDQKNEVKRELDRRLTFTDFARKHFISALHGTGVGDLFKSINEAYQCATASFSTNKITEILMAAVQAHQPPLVKRRRIKLRYSHQGGKNPPRIVIHGTQAESVPDVYKRYLINTFRKKLKLVGVPIVLEFKSGKNPFKGRKNKLTDKQRNKRRRLRKFIKKK